MARTVTIALSVYYSHGMLGGKRDSWRSIVLAAAAAGVLALVVSLAGAGGASGQSYVTPTPMMEPFPVVRIVGAGTTTVTKVTRLTVRGPTASAVVATCKPRSRCPFTRRKRLIPGPANATRTIRLTSVQRRYRSGATLRLYIVKNGLYGKYTSFRIRRGKAPRRYDRCVKSIILKPVRCPGD